MALPVMLQCKDADTVENALDALGSGWVTHDNRVYSHMKFGDNECYWEIDAQTILALYNLQCSIEMSEGADNEMGFANVVARAKELEAAYQAAIKAIKFQPILRKDRVRG